MPAGHDPTGTAVGNTLAWTGEGLDRIWENWVRQRHAGEPARQPAAQPSPAAGQHTALNAKAVFRKWIRDRLAALRPAAALPPAVPETPAVRAEKLLLACLTPEQRRQYKEEGVIVVPGRIHSHYRIRKGRIANVEVLDHKGRVLHRLCAHPTPRVPDADTMLAQVLMLSHHEQEFVAIANRHPGW